MQESLHWRRRRRERRRKTVNQLRKKFKLKQTYLLLRGFLINALLYWNDECCSKVKLEKLCFGEWRTFTYSLIVISFSNIRMLVEFLKQWYAFFLITCQLYSYFINVFLMMLKWTSLLIQFLGFWAHFNAVQDLLCQRFIRQATFLLLINIGMCLKRVSRSCYFERNRCIFSSFWNREYRVWEDDREGDLGETEESWGRRKR